MKAKKVLLVNPPPWGVHNPPIGLGYISEVLDQEGIEHDVLDLNLELFLAVPEDQKYLWHMNNKNLWGNEKTFTLFLEANKKSLDTILNSYDYSEYLAVGFSVVEPRELITNYICEFIQKKNRHIQFFAGNAATGTKKRREDMPYITYFCIGEGELVTKELVKTILDPSKKIEDNDLLIVSREDDAYLLMANRFVKLSEIPYPRYKRFPLSRYLGKSFLYEWSRGCLGACMYCKGKDVMKHNYRPKSPQRVVEEIEYHYRENNIRAFTVCDNLFNGNLKYLEKICDLIIAKGLELEWFGEAVTNKKMTPKLFQKLKRAGCTSIQWGVESASNKVLADMNRLYRRRDASVCIKRAANAGIKNEIFLIIGYPTETEKNFQQTVRFVKRHKKYLDKVKSANMLHLIEGTYLLRHPETHNIIIPEDDWHYRWSAPKNNYAVRHDRLKRFLDYCKKQGIYVQETNINEGAEKGLSNWDECVAFANENV